MARPYYTLLTKDGVSDDWLIAFGDYDRECVKSELDDYRDHGWRRNELKIIKTQSVKQAEVDSAVALLNAGN